MAVRRWLPVPIAGLLAAGITAAVVVEPGDPAAFAALKSIANAPGAVRDAGSARIEMQLTVNTGETKIVFHQDGLIDASGQQATLRLVQEEEGEPRPGPVALLIDGRKAYVGLSQNRSVGLTQGHRWLAADITSLTAENRPVSSPDPLALVEALSGVTGNARRLGRDRINGVPTTHYSVDADLVALATSTGATRLDELSANLANAILTFGRAPHLDVWIDDEGLPRRLTMFLKGSDFNLRYELELTDFGAAVGVDAPRAGDVLEVESLQDAFDLAGLR